MEHNMIAEKELTQQVVTPDELLKHWQGHRSLTRRVIEAFPEEALFAFSIGGMRTFAEILGELTDLAGDGIRGIATGEWKAFDDLNHTAGKTTISTRQQILDSWDEASRMLDIFFPQIALERFHDTVLAFGQYEGSIYSTVLYFIDNEIHHRGQGYVYLRALGITPPPFYER